MNRLDLAALVDSWIRPASREALAILRRGDRGDLGELRTLRDEALAALAAYVWENVPYYRRVMEERGFSPADVRGLDDLRRFPVLTKDIIRREGAALRSGEIERLRPLVRRSGGTTGEPIASYVTPLAAALETWSYFRGLRWMGWQPGEKRVLFTGGSLGTARADTLRDRLRNFASGVVALPAFELDRSTFPRYCDAVERAAPCLLTGYASVLRDFAVHCEESGRAPKGITRIVSTAEQMPPTDSAFLTRVLGAPVQSFYGCGEVNSLGYQTTPDGPYFVPDEHAVVETADGDEGVEAGSLLVTALFNRAQPLIRYANGDAGTVAPGDDASKRSRIVELHGRTSDMFVRRDGSRLSGSFAPHMVLVLRLPVRRYQLIQHDLERIELRYEPVAGDLGDAQKAEVIRVVREHMRDAVAVELVRTSEFRRSPLGKHRIMICDLEGAR